MNLDPSTVFHCFLLAILAIVVHFFFDWILQPRYIAENKSKKLWVLFVHCTLQFIGFGLVLYIAGLGLNTIVSFALVNALTHAVIDWNIWNSYKYFAVKRIKKLARKRALERLNRKYTEGDDDSVTRLPSYQFNFEKSMDELITEFRNGGFSKDYWFYFTIAVDQTLHLVILLALLGIALHTV